MQSCVRDKGDQEGRIWGLREGLTLEVSTNTFPPVREPRTSGRHWKHENPGSRPCELSGALAFQHLPKATHLDSQGCSQPTGQAFSASYPGHAVTTGMQFGSEGRCSNGMVGDPCASQTLKTPTSTVFHYTCLLTFRVSENNMVF